MQQFIFSVLQPSFVSLFKNILGELTLRWRSANTSPPEPSLNNRPSRPTHLDDLKEPTHDRLRHVAGFGDQTLTLIKIAALLRATSGKPDIPYQRDCDFIIPSPSASGGGEADALKCTCEFLLYFKKQALACCK